MADEPPSPAAGETALSFAHYRVLRRPDGSAWELGRGAMGVTYKAYDERLRIDVALKLITPGQVDDPKTQTLFLREARAAARVRHPNVASVVYLNDTPGNFFYAMEFIDGESLADWLRARGPMPPALAIEFALQIARGLEAIHAQQIVHRDLKPANLMIVSTAAGTKRARSESDPDAWQIKIIDFGLARGFGGTGLGTEADAQTVGFRGTALYASPEQCEERGQIDGRSDLYSLGCILWEMLLGVPPFRARTHRELLNQHVSLPAPLERVSHLSSSLQTVLARLLQKDPSDRFPDAEAVVKALEQCRERAQGDAKVGQIGVTTRDEEPAEGPTRATAPASPARRLGIGLAIASVALLIVAASWYFSRDRTGATVSTSATPPVVSRSPTMTPSPAPPEISRKSIAVLPFENLSGRPEDAYLADGLQEEILNALARLRDLKVISRTSVKEYRGKDLNIREIGRRLDVGTIIEGSVRREGNTLRLTIQVIDARDDHHLLATSYDRDLGNVLELQAAVARQVAEALSTTLTRQEAGELDRVTTTNGDAYDRYLRALALFRQPVPNDDLGVVESKGLLEEAMKLDPNFAEAQALLSQASTWIYLKSERPEDAVAAKVALERTIAIDSKSPESQLARGLYALYVSKNRDQALIDLGAVVKMRPNSAVALNALGFALRRSGRMEEALALLVRAWDIDPLNLAYAEAPSSTLAGLRRYREQIDQTEIFAKRFPTSGEPYFFRASLQAQLLNDSKPLHSALREYGNLLSPKERQLAAIQIAEFEGRYLDAIKLWEEIPILRPFERAVRLGCLYYAAGDAVQAEQNFRRAETYALEVQKSEPGKIDLRELAFLYSMMGKHDEALELVEPMRKSTPESRDPVNGPQISLLRSFILVRSGRTEEGYAEVARLLHVPFGAPIDIGDLRDPMSFVTKSDPRLDELINHPPRL